MEQTDLYKQKLVRGKRTYFFDIKKTEKEDFYIKLTEGKKSNDGFEYHRIMVFEEDVEDFYIAFWKCLIEYRKLKEEKSK